MNNRRIIGIGETVLDVIFRNDQPMAAVPGGSAFNAMVSLGRSVGMENPEIPILMITETGDDHIGDIIVKFMRDNNISTDAVTRNKGNLISQWLFSTKRTMRNMSFTRITPTQV